MKRDDIKIGSVYIARVSGRRVKVKIDADLGEGIRLNGRSYHRGWTATNLMTRRTVRIATAQRLSPEVAEAADLESRLRRVQQLRDRIAYRGLGPLED